MSGSSGEERREGEAPGGEGALRNHRLLRRLLLLVATIGALSVSGCTTMGYLWKQGGYLLHDSLGAQSIGSLLANPDTPASTRDFLQRVESIRDYAIQVIGLSGKRNFTSYKEIKRDYLVNVVQASAPLSFTPYEWSYPLLGRLPYRGFYLPADAQKEADRLKKLGYDVIVRRVDAFSTLGFLKDPVYSFMDRYSDFDLASLIIHEQTHATVFLKGQDQFNEELATFVGDTGALDYLAATYGKGSPEYEQGIAEEADSALFIQFIRRLTEALRAVYAEAAPDSVKLAEKESTIARYEKIFASDYLPRFRSPGYRSSGPLPITNAYLMLFDLYTADIPTLEAYYARVCGSDLRLFVERVKELAKGRGSMEEKLKTALEKKPG